MFFIKDNYSERYFSNNNSVVKRGDRAIRQNAIPQQLMLQTEVVNI
jgi:hypothetical protein